MQALTSTHEVLTQLLLNDVHTQTRNIAPYAEWSTTAAINMGLTAAVLGANAYGVSVIILQRERCVVTLFGYP